MPNTVPTNLGPPVARVIPLTEFEAATALFAGWKGRFEQLSSGQFKGTIRIVRGGLVRVMGAEANQSVSIRGHDVSGLFSVYPVTPGGAGDVWQGHRLDPGHLVINGVQTEVDHYSSRRTESVGISLYPETLVSAARALLNTDAVSLPETWAAVSPPPEAFAGLTHRLSRLLHLSSSGASLLGTVEGNQVEQECVRALVAALFATDVRKPDLPFPARALVLRRAEEFMRSHLTEPVGAVDLCRELGVNDRTLRLAFRERYGIGPMVFYKYLRLNAVRSRLRLDPLLAVATIAGEYGFHHHGNFAADYRRLFGERPSETRDEG